MLKKCFSRHGTDLTDELSTLGAHVPITAVTTFNQIVIIPEMTHSQGFISTEKRHALLVI